MSAPNTSAPSLARLSALARPIPEAAPVLNATLPSKRPIAVPSWLAGSARAPDGNVSRAALVDYHPFSDAVFDDPYPIYQRLRDEAPLYYLDEFDCWFVSRFADVWAL